MEKYLTNNSVLGLLILTFILSSCGSINFPTEITSTITDKHFRIMDTKLFVKTPPEYEYFEGANLFHHKDSTSISVMTVPSNFYSVIENSDFDFFFNKSFEITSEQRFTINNLPGMLFELKENEITYFYFFYGDSLTENRILGILPKNSNQRQNIFDFVSGSYYDNSLEIDPLENAKFRIYPSIMDFHLNSSIMNQYMYVEDGYEEYWDKQEKYNFISISQLPNKADKKSIEAIFETMLGSVLGQGIEITEVISNDTLTVDSNYAKAIAFEAKYGFDNMIIYMLTTGRNNTVIHVVGTFYHDGEKLIPKIHAITGEMKIVDDW